MLRQGEPTVGRLPVVTHPAGRRGPDRTHLRGLDPAEQRVVGAVEDAYIELDRVLAAVGTLEPDPSVAETFAQVARLLLAEEGVERTLVRIGQLAVQTIDGCDHAGISLVERRTVNTVGASDDVPAKVDRIQYEVAEGPCLDAISRHEVFHCGRLDEERRWPAFSRRACEETGVTSVVAFRLFVEHDTMGALNLRSPARSRQSCPHPREASA